jgi:fructoselysine-6-P-deglycase FrlB-like protein
MSHTAVPASSFLAREIASQPEAWRTAARVAVDQRVKLPTAGERVAVIGCGTSWFIAQAYASLREAAGHGETDAFAASEMPRGRRYDRVLCISRSGTTTEVLEVLAALGAARRATTVAVTADADTPIVDAANAAIVLPFADERSVVQTVFATSALALLRAHLGDDVERLADQAAHAIESGADGRAMEAEQMTFLGSGAGAALAHEAALKLREAAQCWTEAYPAMEYRHGPISIAQPGRAVWALGPLPSGLADDIVRTGASLLAFDEDPSATLVRAHMVAEALARARGLNPDQPRHLTRSVVLPA